MKIFRIIISLLAIILMCTIFSFSSQPAEESTDLSNEVGFFVGRLFVPGFNELSEAQQYQYADSIDFYVRKSAHATEYLFLCILCALSLYLWFLQYPYLSFLLGWLITLFYAETDEIHQYFVPGRACMLMDVGIDAAGAAIGLGILSLFYSLIRRHKNRKADVFLH